MATTPDKKKRPDWAAIQRDYRTGKFTFRELEDKHGVGYASINRKAKAEAWQKDLSQVVREATEAAVIRDAVLQQGAATGTATATEPQQQNDPDVVAVMAAVELNKEVLLRHRRDIRDARDLTMTMLGELKVVGENPDSLEIMFEHMTSEMKPEELMNATRAYNALVKLPGRIGSVHKLADTLAKLQPLERKAFALDNGADDTPPPEGSQADNETARRIAFILEKGLRAQKG
jgi:hypothetical protein